MSTNPPAAGSMTRRDLLSAGAEGAGAPAATLLSDPLIARALAAPPACDKLGDVERSDPHPGEPLLRPLLRHSPRGPRLRRPVRCGATRLERPQPRRPANDLNQGRAPQHGLTSAPLSLLADTADPLASLESTLVSPYPVPPPPQIQPAQQLGRSPRPSGVVARRR